CARTEPVAYLLAEDGYGGGSEVDEEDDDLGQGVEQGGELLGVLSIHLPQSVDGLCHGDIMRDVCRDLRLLAPEAVEKRPRQTEAPRERLEIVAEQRQLRRGDAGAAVAVRERHGRPV